MPERTPPNKPKRSTRKPETERRHEVIGSETRVSDTFKPPPPVPPTPPPKRGDNPADE